MPHIKKYLNALREAVGERKYPLALAQLRAAHSTLTPKQLQELQFCKDNKERLQLLGKWCGNFLADEVKNVIALLSEKNQLDLLSTIQETDASSDSVTVITAKPLSQEDKSWIATELRNVCGEAKINFAKDESLIGGVKIRIGDREIDNSIKTKLTTLLSS